VNVLIVEDESPAAANLIEMLAQTAPDMQVLAVLSSVPEAVAWLQKNTSELIFLDVNLGDELAFDIFKQVQIDTPVIFTTAYDKYALQAFRLNSIDYLLKPIDKEDLNRSVQKFRQQLLKSAAQVAFLSQDLMKVQKEYQTRFIVNSGEKIKSVSSEEIAYFQGHKKYVFLNTYQKEKFIVDNTLEKLEEVLNPKHFFRVNRQFIVGFKAISQMFAHSRGRIKIELNPPLKDDVVVSIDRAMDFKAWLNQ
jgi:two-component system, LytTR family, response regulator LytT